MRHDLAALTDDDLVALTNRGTVRRARGEVDAGALTVELVEADDGTVTARWSDDATCVVPSGVSLARARCTCPAEPPCRHLVRTVMAYAVRAAAVPPADEDAPAHTAAPVPAPIRARAQKLFDEGQLFELVRAGKPIARCHSLGVVTRFLVPGDPHHAVCDCGQEAPCEHAVLALLAFERLDADMTSGLVDTRTTPYPIPTEALDALEATLASWVQVGLADAPSALRDALGRVEDVSRRAGLVWMAEGIADLAILKAAYDARDARFDTTQLAEVVGELVVRIDATRASRGLVPPLFIRGTPRDKTTEIASARYVGLGCEARVRRASIDLTTYLEDEDTGQLVCVVRRVGNDVADRETPLSALGRTRIAKGITLEELARGRSLVKGAKRTAGGVLALGRAPASCQPQAFAWERLRAPVLAESFAEVQAHLASLPPRPLRPRRLAEDVYVVPIDGVSASGFDSVEQAVRAELRDARGERAELVHGYHSRARSGSAALLDALAREKVVFVSGRFRRTPRGLCVAPLGLVVERDGVRRLVQPAIDDASVDSGGVASQPTERRGPAQFLGEELARTLGELFVVGVEGFTERHAKRLRERAEEAASLGFAALPVMLTALAERPDVSRLLELAAMSAIAEDL